jgi:hypothetical protein
MHNCRRHTSGCPSEADDPTSTTDKPNFSCGGFGFLMVETPHRPFRLVVAVLVLLGAATFILPAQAHATGGATENLQSERALEDTDPRIDAYSGKVTRAMTSGAGSKKGYSPRSKEGNASGIRTEVERREGLVEFTLVNASGLEEIYFVYEPEGWESARTFEGIEEGISVTLRTEASASRLLESEEVLIPDGMDLGFDGFVVEGREATETEEVTCLYDHNGYSFLDVEVPAEIDIPCHAPKYRESEYIDEGTGTPISLKEGEYRFIGKIDGEETVILSHTVDNVNTSASSTDTGADRTEEDSGGEMNETKGADGKQDKGDTDGFPGVAAAGLGVLFAILAFSLFGAKRLNNEERDRDRKESPGEKGLLSNEGHVLTELERNDGRMKQQALVESLDWTEAKTSRIVNEMQDEGTIDKYRLGRENVIALPEKEKQGSDE